MNDSTEARRAFEKELQRLINKPPSVLTERLIDLIQAIQTELKKE